MDSQGPQGDREVAPTMSERFTPAAVEALSRTLGEPSWLAERRAHAFEVFEKLELPDPKGEEWRYTDVRRFDFSRFAPPEPRASAPEVPAALAAKGVVVADFAIALKEHEDLLKEHFFTEVAVDEHKFTALHAAFHSDDLLVYVPKGVDVDVPIEAFREISAGGSTFPHTTIVVDEGSRLTFVDRFRSKNAEQPSLCCSVVEVEARSGSTVNYISLQEWGRNVEHFQTQRFTGYRDTTVRSLAVNLGAGLARTQVESVLKGEGSFSEMLGLYFGDREQHVAQRTLQAHEAPHATSDLLYKG